jgi:hypothetical protein
MEKTKKRIICLLMAVMMTISSLVMCACTPEKDESSDEALRAADPMTEEEMAEDDSEGCIEDSEDLLN